MTPLSKLKALTDCLLDENNSWGEKRQVVNEIAALFAGLGIYDIQTNNREIGEAVPLAEGYAISSWGAAMCLLEVKRTMVFVKGIIAAIQTLQHKNTNPPLHILDAGCGPFALLSILPALYFKPGSVQFHLIDIIPENIQAVKKLIKVLSLVEYFGDLFVADAIQFKWQRKEPLNMVISETMLNALRKEPQVAITLNLAPQLAPGGLLIPENIQVNLYAVNNGLKHTHMLSASNSLKFNREAFEKNIATIMVLNKDTKFEQGLTKQLSTFRIDCDLDFSLYKFEYYTFIQVFNNQVLEYNDCSLTLPYSVVRNNLPPIEPAMELSFYYNISDQPGIGYYIKQ